jgi:3-oxoacyl-[acyl-carrier-protein] synthase-3
VSLYILGMGYSHPSIIIDNQFLEDLDVGTTAQWIIEKIGIKTRLTTLPLEYIRETRNLNPAEAIKVASMTPTDMGVKAAQMALDRSGLRPEQIGLVICNCCTPAQTAPAEAQRIADKLRMRVKAYDVFTACPAFALHIDFLNSFKEEKLPEYILCVSTAALTQHVNYNDRSDGAIWGDGAAAWIVSPKVVKGLRVVDTNYMADPTRCQAVVVDTYGHFHQDGRAVRDFSVRQTVRMVKAMEVEHNLDWSKDIFIGHQANKTMLEQIANNRNIPESNHWYNVTTVGNQAGAGAPATLAMNWDKIYSGQRIAVAVVGAGLSWGHVLLEAV